MSKRCKKSKTRARPPTTAEVVLRMLPLKHIRGWSYEDVTREVRSNLVYREFTGVVMKKAAAAAEAGVQYRDRSRSVKRSILEIVYARNKREKGQDKMKAGYPQAAGGDEPSGRTGPKVLGCSYRKSQITTR